MDLFDHGILFFIFLIMNVLDWLSGWLKARILKQENSSAGFIGAVKKLANWFVVFCSFLLSYAFLELGMILHVDTEIASGLGWLVLISLIINEVRSVLENLIQCKIKVPNIFIKGLNIADENIDDYHFKD